MTRYEDLTRKIEVLESAVQNCVQNGIPDVARIFYEKRNALVEKREALTLEAAEHKI